MDRIAIHMHVPQVDHQKLRDIRPGETSSEVRLRVEAASERQLQLMARAYHRELKLSRTIADLAGFEAIIQVHLAEVLQYRPKLIVA